MLTEEHASFKFQQLLHKSFSSVLVKQRQSRKKKGKPRRGEEMDLNPSCKVRTYHAVFGPCLTLNDLFYF